MELPLAVFVSLSGPTGGSAITMIRRFQQSWRHIEQATNEVASDDVFDEQTHLGLCSSSREMVTFCKAALEGSHQREDNEVFLTSV